MLIKLGCMGQSSTNSTQIHSNSLKADEETSVSRRPYQRKPVQPILETKVNPAPPVAVQKPQACPVPSHTKLDMPCIVSVRSLSDGSASSSTSSCDSLPGYDTEALSQPLRCPYFNRNVTYRSGAQPAKALAVNSCHNYFFNLALLAEAAISHNLDKFGINQSASNKDISASSTFYGRPSNSTRSERPSISNEVIRSKNNEACRKSRIKRKKGREENEAKLKMLRDSNHDLKLRVQRLEAEVKEARDRLVDEMRTTKKV